MLAGSSLGRKTSYTTRMKLRYANLLREYNRQKYPGETVFAFSLRRIDQKFNELESRRIRLFR